MKAVHHLHGTKLYSIGFSLAYSEKMCCIKIQSQNEILKVLFNNASHEWFSLLSSLHSSCNMVMFTDRYNSYHYSHFYGNKNSASL